jgi:hypothetical protein
MIGHVGPRVPSAGRGLVRVKESPVRIHPLFATAAVALVVVIGYNKFAGGKGHSLRVGP